MASLTLHDPAGPLDHLQWDSHHFGMPVTQIRSGLNDADLASALDQAREQGTQLAYFSTGLAAPVAMDLQQEFCGALVDRKVTYRADLRGSYASSTSSVVIEPFPRGPASADLKELSREAAGMSRFRVDPRIPEGACDRMYDIWIDRSTQRELANTVLVARQNQGGDILGMITGKVADGVGKIGLVAVVPAARGQGVGIALMNAVRREMRYLGATTSYIVTQSDNQAACRCYERSGYQVDEAQLLYHFWLQVPATEMIQSPATYRSAA